MTTAELAKEAEAEMTWHAARSGSPTSMPSPSSLVSRASLEQLIKASRVHRMEGALGELLSFDAFDDLPQLGGYVAGAPSKQRNRLAIVLNDLRAFLAQQPLRVVEYGALQRESTAGSASGRHSASGPAEPDEDDGDDGDGDTDGGDDAATPAALRALGAIGARVPPFDPRRQPGEMQAAWSTPRSRGCKRRRSRRTRRSPKRR